jgi:DNA-binding CsgD family transcriptional regulator
MDTKEIANLMTISPRGVEIARYRLRKKFKLETHQNLAKFILEY